MKNIESFSVYVTKILSELHENFPISVHLDRQGIIQDRLSFEYENTLNTLKMEKDLAEIFMATEDENSDLYKASAEQAPQKSAIISDMEEEKEAEQSHQLRVLDGTIEFLVAEKFIRSSSNGYMLTNKGFASLSKSSDSDGSYAEVFNRIFDVTGEAAKEFTMQTVVAMASAYLMAAITL